MNCLKKLLVVASVGVLALTFSGCGQKNVEGNLSDILDKIYADIPEDEFPMALEKFEVTEENVAQYLGTSDIEFKEALASESMIGSFAYSVVLLRVKDGADVEKVKTQIKENVNPRKWICVWVEDENVIVDSKGDLVILIMSNDLATKIQKGFQKLK